MKKILFFTGVFLICFVSNLPAQRFGSSKIEIKFNDGEIITYELSNSKDRSYYNFIMSERFYTIIYKKIVGEDAYRIVPEMPQFNGGNGNLKTYMKQHLKYPQEALDQKLEGMIYIEFLIDKSGKTKTCQIARGVGPILDKAALEFANSLPDWKPGRLDGEAVNVYYMILVNFEML